MHSRTEAPCVHSVSSQVGPTPQPQATSVQSHLGGALDLRVGPCSGTPSSHEAQSLGRGTGDGPTLPWDPGSPGRCAQACNPVAIGVRSGWRQLSKETLSPLKHPFRHLGGIFQTVN